MSLRHCFSTEGIEAMCAHIDMAWIENTSVRKMTQIGGGGVPNQLQIRSNDTHDLSFWLKYEDSADATLANITLRSCRNKQLLYGNSDFHPPKSALDMRK